MSDRFVAWDPTHRRRPAEVVAGPAGGHDVAALVALAEEHTGLAAGWTGRFAADLSESRRALFVARVDGTPAGYGRVAYLCPPQRSASGGAPPGWYLAGLVVAPPWRGCGAGGEVTRARVDWVAQRAGEVWYYANAANAVSLALHAQLGFEEVTRDVSIPGVSFDGGVGVLCRLYLGSGRRPAVGAQGRQRR